MGFIIYVLVRWKIGTLRGGLINGLPQELYFKTTSPKHLSENDLQDYSETLLKIKGTNCQV